MVERETEWYESRIIGTKEDFSEDFARWTRRRVWHGRCWTITGATARTSWGAGGSRKPQPSGVSKHDDARLDGANDGHTSAVAECQGKQHVSTKCAGCSSTTTRAQHDEPDDDDDDDAAATADSTNATQYEATAAHCTQRI